jgi:hypothetical protein
VAVKELLKMEDFYDAILGGEGYVVITDAAKPAIAHPPHCPSLQGEHFKEKVVRNAGRSGRYFWVATRTEAREELAADHCSCA